MEDYHKVTVALLHLAITSDSNHIISGAADNTVRISNLEDNSQEAVLHGHTDMIYSILVGDFQSFSILKIGNLNFQNTF